MAIICKFPFWPFGPGWPVSPIFAAGVLVGLLAIAGAIFSLVMLIDCLKRQPSQFLNPLTKEGEYDKLIWAIAIVISLSYYFIGAIVYFFVVMKAKPTAKTRSVEKGGPEDG